MKAGFVFVFLLIIAMFSEFGYAASSSEAVLQVTGYSVVPSKAYPGTKGYMQLTLENSGTQTATGITAEYSNSYTYQAISVASSDIGAGATSQISIPFEVPAESGTGLLLYKIKIYYFSSDVGNTKTTTYSIPIEVSQDQILQVDTLSMGKESLSPGEKVSITINIINTGGTINDLSITTPQNSSFSIDGSTRKYVGSVSSNSNKTITLDLASSSLASVGQYLIPLNFNYDDSLQNPSNQTLYVGPINVLDPFSQLRVSLESLSSTEIGSQAEFNLVLENDGSGSTSAIVDIISTDQFTPLGGSKLFFSAIESGKKASMKVKLGISSSISAGYYELPLNITLGTGRTFIQKVGVPVSATPEIRITRDTSTSTTGNEIVIQIANTGNTAVRSMYVLIEYGGTKTEKFIGTLSIDDYTTISVTSSGTSGNFTGSPSGAFPNAQYGRNASANSQQIQNRSQSSNQTVQMSGNVIVTVTFKDEQNQPHTVTQTISASSSGIRQVSASTTQRSTQNKGIIFGLSLLQIAGIIALAGIAFFAYKKYYKKKTEAEKTTD